MIMNDVQKEMYSTRSSLVCGECGGVEFTTKLGFDGFTTHEYSLYVLCDYCGIVNEVARLTTDSYRIVELKRKPNEIRKDEKA